jgi:hypothetical protein
VELVFNLVWAVGAVLLLSFAYRSVRRGTSQLSMASAITLALLLCFILLPVISASDDLLDARQAALPLYGQTWKMSSQGIRIGLEALAVSLYVLLLMCFLLIAGKPDVEPWFARPLAGRLVRSQRLRPPLPSAC